MAKQARRILCSTCPHYRTCGTWASAKCYFAHPDTEDPSVVPDLTAERFNAGEPACPSGRWQEHDEPGATWTFPMRRQVCAECEHGRWLNGYDSPLCVIGPEVRTRDSAFMQGPDANCPLGKWSGIEQLPIVRKPKGQPDAKEAEDISLAPPGQGALQSP